MISTYDYPCSRAAEPVGAWGAIDGVPVHLPSYEAGKAESAKPRTVATVEELDALPIGAVLLSDVGGVWERWKLGEWFEPASTRGNPAHHLALPARVLYVPDSPPSARSSPVDASGAESDTTGATGATGATGDAQDVRGNG